jgi:hypothetical protein
MDARIIPVKSAASVLEGTPQQLFDHFVGAQQQR